MKSKFIALSFSLLLGLTLVGQYSNKEIESFMEKASEKKLVQKNTELLEEGYFLQSIMVADKLLSLAPDNTNYNYRKGFALYRSSVDVLKAKPYFKLVENDLASDYNFYSHRETGAPLEVLFYLARIYHLSKDLESAEEYYKRYSESVGADVELIQKAKHGLKQCQVAKELLEHDERYIIKNVGPVINQATPEYAPIISADGTALYFTTRRLRSDESNLQYRDPETNYFAEDVYASYKDNDGNWEPPVLLDFCQPDNNDATVSVSIDGRKIYVYDGTIGNGDILLSEYSEGKYQDPVPLDIPGLNTDAWETHLTFSPDGRTVIFCSDRDGGYGGRDLYIMHMDDEGNWSEPENLGPQINTEHDEDAPFLAIDKKTLYFSSNGEKSMGGFDVFVTTLQSDGLWSEPLNLGYPLNTTGDDIYYTTTSDGFVGYYSSFRKDGFGNTDIYEVHNNKFGLTDIAVLKGEIETIDGSSVPEDVAFTVKCISCDQPFVQTYSPRISDGTYLSTLRLCEEYEVTFHSDNGNNIFHTDIINTTCEDNYEEIFRNIVFDKDGEMLSVVDPSNVISSFDALELTHFFGYNNRELNKNEGAFKEFISAVEKQASLGRTEIVLEITASASRVPTKKEGGNERLAELRANSMKELLEEHFNDSRNKVTIKVNKTKIDGPRFSSKDKNNPEKFMPYQYVRVTLAGVNTVNQDVTVLKSKDDEFKGETTKIESKTAVKVMDEAGDKFTSGSIVESEYTYLLVVGVFKRKEYAEKLVKSLQKKGYDGAKIYGKQDGRNMVVVAESNSLEECKAELEKYKSGENKSAWIMNTKK